MAQSNVSGKPKAFFIQCCRGGEHQETVVQPDDDRDDENDKVQVPTDGDVYIAHATTEGKHYYRYHCMDKCIVSFAFII